MSCEVEAALVWERPKDPDESIKYAVDFGPDLARRWQPDRTFAAGIHIQPTRGKANGRDYECTVAGRTGAREPTWPTVLGAIVADGSVQWTCRAPSTASQNTTIVGTPTWTPDDGVTASSPAIVNSEAAALLSLGIDGQNYTVIVTATTADGQTLKQICVLRVRRAVLVCP